MRAAVRHQVNRGDAEASGFRREPRVVRRPISLWRRGCKVSADDQIRVLFDPSVQTAGTITLKSSAFRIGNRFVDAGPRECGTVQDGAVPREHLQPDWAIANEAVEPGAMDVLIVPDTAADLSAERRWRWSLGERVCDRSRQLINRWLIRHRNVECLDTRSDVNVCVVESRHDGSSAEIDTPGPGTRRCHDCVVRSDGHNSLATNGDRFRPQIFGVRRKDLAVDENRVGRRGGAGARVQSQRQDAAPEASRHRHIQ
jgi:hypothetical protein